MRGERESKHVDGGACEGRISAKSDVAKENKQQARPSNAIENDQPS
jgi:hypothetical protein